MKGLLCINYIMIGLMLTSLLVLFFRFIALLSKLLLFESLFYMDKALDMSLDDIIKSKKSAGRGKGRGGAPRVRGGRGGSFSGGRMRGVGRGSGRQGHLGVNTRPSSFAIAKASLNFGCFMNSF